MVRGILAKQEGNSKEALEKALSHARKSGSKEACWDGWNGARYTDVPLSDGGYKALRLAPEEFVKEAALQLELLLSDNRVGGGISGYVHHCVATLTLFLKMVSSEALIAVAADACVKVVEYLGKVEYTLSDMYPHDNEYSVPFDEFDVKKEYDAISSLCERIIERADAPVVDPVDGKRKAPKRNRVEYEEQFCAGH
jgi:hypothetical protein